MQTYQTHHAAPAQVIPMAEIPAEVLTWIAGAAAKSDFAKSLQAFSARRKGLTPGQINAVTNLVAPKAPAAAVNAEGIARLTAAFASALANEVKRPKLRIAGYHMKPAKPDGKNPGAIYVMQNTTYLGKVADGKFLAVRECTPEQRTEIIELCTDPFAAAKAHGMKTGECACCGRELSNHESLELGIGPICAGNFGWA